MEIWPNGWKTIDATANVSLKENSVWSDENYNTHHKNQRICAFIYEESNIKALFTKDVQRKEFNGSKEKEQFL